MDPSTMRRSPAERSGRARRLAMLLGAPGLTATFVLGAVVGLAAVGGRSGAAAVPSAPPATSGPADGGETTPTSPGPSTTRSPGPTARPSPAPSSGFALSAESLPIARWPGPIADLVRAVPGGIRDVTVLAVTDERGVQTDWTITFAGPASIRTWTASLPAYLEAHGFSAIEAGTGGTYAISRGAGVAATVSDGYGADGTPAVFVAIRVSTGAVTAGGFADDRRGEIVRRGCTGMEVAALEPFLAVLADAGATGIDAGRCRDDRAATGRAYRAVGFLTGDPVALADRLMTVYEAGGVRPSVGVSADSLWWDLTWSGVQIMLTRQHVPVGLSSWTRGSLSFVAIRRDPFQPDTWRVEVYLPTLEVGPDGRLLPDGALYPGAA